MSADRRSQDQLFAPPEVEWQRLSPGWRTTSRIGVVITYTLLFGLPAAALWRFLDWRWAMPLIVIGLVVMIWRFIRMDLLYRSWGYAELDQDLYITHGVTYRNLTAVPYARMQLVEIESGPIERAFGLSTVKLVTASSSSNATIPGLDAQRATALRDRLTQHAESGSSGL